MNAGRWPRVRSRHRNSHYQIIAAATAIISGLCGHLAIASDGLDRGVAFDIPAETLSKALVDFGHQARVQIMLSANTADGQTSKQLKGTLRASTALETLLRGTGLAYDAKDNTVIVGPVAAPAVADKNSFRLAEAASSRYSAAATNPDTPIGSQDIGSVKGPGNEQSESQTEDNRHTPEVLIRGSRVTNVDVKRTEDDVQPYYIFDSKQIEQSGATNAEDFLKQYLTMNTTILSNSQNLSSARGTNSAINLRGLGTNETLILIDGRRSAGVSAYGNADQPDINGIPLSAIERIDVLPSSASAIYGGAAVGGVVNIILKKNFQGGQVDAIYDNTTSASAPIRTISATYGLSLEGGKTQLMLSGGYSDARVLREQDRLRLITSAIGTIFRNSPAFFYSPSNPFPGATTNIATVDGSNLSLKNGQPLGSPITYVSAGAAPNSSLSSTLLANAGAYNLNLAPGTGPYGLQSAIGTVPTTKSFMITARREMTSFLDVFSDFSTRSNASLTEFNPIGTGGPYTIPASAPTSPFQQDVLVTFPTSLSVPFTTDTVTQSMTVGFVARLPADWTSELDYTWSRSSFEYAQYTSDDAALGADLAAGIVNPFADTIAHPLKLAAYLAPYTYSGRSSLNDVGFRDSGPIGSLPWGNPNVTIGLEHRREVLHPGDLNVDYPLTPANTLQQKFFGQSQSTDSVYVEAQVPLVAEKNAIPGIRSLDVQLAGRSERYTVNAGTPYEYISPAYYQASNPTQGLHTKIEYTSTNPTIGLKYRPIQDLTFRVSYARAFLPPTAQQLLPNPTLSSYGGYLITDPQNGQTYGVHEIAGGNPNLKPQIAKDWDFGLILEPQALLTGLRMDLEYYRITQPDYITQPQPQQVVSNRAYASRVTRDPATGLITVVNVSYLNAEEYRTSGWDLTMDYRKSTDFGTFNLHGLGTLVEHDQRQYTIGGRFADYVGFPGEGGEARIKANATFSWEYRRWTLGWTTTYFGSYLQVYGSPGSPYAIQSGQPYTFYTDAQGGYKIPSQVYHDIFVSYVFDKTAHASESTLAGKALSGLAIQFRVKNVFNTLPPFDAYYGPASGGGNFYSPYGDPRLRDYRISVSKSF